MPNIVYPWKRFWCPREGRINLADHGFLLDPESEYAHYHPSDVVTFESIAGTRCMVLLGEPGIGKTTAIRDEFERVKNACSISRDMALWFDLRDYSSDERLERKVFRCPEMDTWRSGKQVLHLFLDSIDEGLLRIDNISGVLLSEIVHLPKDRLRLRIASRSADWQVSLEQGLIDFWDKDTVRAFELAPLRKDDVAVAAKASGIAPPQQFVEAVIKQDVVPLAIKPVSLRFLINVYAKGGALPGSRVELYLNGCRWLCEEPNIGRRDSPLTREKLSADQRLAVAARIAAATQLSNRSAIGLSSTASREPEDVSPDSLIGGSEGGPDRQTVVDLDAIRETVNTGLFSSRGLSRQGWAHQSYAEYLAAYHLHTHHVSWKRLRSLILHPDGSEKVVPQLREIAAWLAAMDKEVFEQLVRTDPAVLLRNDVKSTSDAERALLATRLLEECESGGVLQHLWEKGHDFSRLRCPQLPDVCRPYLTSANHNQDARIAAMEIASECKLSDLQTELIAIALDPQEHHRVRYHAAAGISDIGDVNARAALRPLALGSGGEDARDDLRGFGLSAVWPDYITSEELFTALTPMKAPDYFGQYKRFLDSNVAEKLKASDMPAAMKWAQGYIRGRDDADKLFKIASDVLEQAVDHIDQPQVLQLLATTLFRRAAAYTDCDRMTARLRDSGDHTRRVVAHAMFETAAPHKHGAFLVRDVCAIGADDVQWLLIEIASAHESAVRHLIAELIARTLPLKDADVFDAVLQAGSSDPLLKTAIEPLIAPVYFGSNVAKRLKADHTLFMANQRPKLVRPVVPLGELITEALAQDDQEAFFRVHWILHENVRAYPEAGEPMPGWAQLDAETRTVVIRSAFKFLQTRPPTASGAWWKEGTFTAGLLAGSSALRLLAIQSPTLLDQLEDDDWAFWARIALTDWPGDSRVASRGVLLQKAYSRAGAVFTSTFSDIIDGENERHGQVFVTARLAIFWNDELGRVLSEKLIGATLKPGSFKNVLSKLLEIGNDDARTVAKTMAIGAVPTAGDNRKKVLFATAELLAHDHREWRIVWPVLQADQAFGIEVLGLIAYERQYSSFAQQLEERQIAEICIWLSRLGLDHEERSGLITPRMALARWWNTLINFLMYKGTVASCDAIRDLIAALPRYEGLKFSLREAEERTRRSTWISPNPEEVIVVVSNSEACMVRNGRELIEVLIESLSRLESELQGITASAEALWDEVPTGRDEPRIFRPKGETSFSNHVKRHLDKDLRERGVILNREVEIRPSMGGQKGEDTDIFVDILVPREQPEQVERISAVIEVKGCWNPELGSAMETQLANRYMSASGVHYGIYLVGWFVCPQWDAADYRRARTPRIPIEEAMRQFEEQSVGLSNDGRLIRAVVLNTALR